MAALIAIAGTATTVRAGDDASHEDGSAYTVTPLVSNIAGAAATQDKVLQNAWGVAFSPAGSPFCDPLHR